MKVYFIKELPGFAKKGEIKNVKSGYFLNFLKPNRYAILLDEKLEKKLKIEEKSKIEDIEKIKAISEMLNGFDFKFKLKTKKDKKVFGSISKRDIILKIKEFLNEKNFNLEDIDVDIEKIKNLGNYKVKVFLPYGFFSEINVTVEEE